MQIRPLHIIVTSNFKIESMFNGSVYAAIDRRFDKIYMSDHGEMSVMKRPSCEPNHQFLSVLKSLNYVSSPVPAPQDVAGPSNLPTEAEKENIQ